VLVARWGSAGLLSHLLPAWADGGAPCSAGWTAALLPWTAGTGTVIVLVAVLRDSYGLIGGAFRYLT
jgi:hypothetical protein